MFSERVKSQLEFLSRAQRKRPIEKIAGLISARICHGWAFTGQSIQEHDKEVEEIKQEVYRQLGKSS